MSEIKQVWGIIKNYQCADLKMVQDPALAVFQHQQAIIDDLIYKAKLRESDHQALLVKYQATKKCWEDIGKECEGLKTQLNNMEQCYIEKKKQVEAANTVLINWQDEYTEHTHQHECTTDAVLRTCIAELRQALRGAND